MRFIDLAWMIPIFSAIAFLIIGFITKNLKELVQQLQ